MSKFTCGANGWHDAVHFNRGRRGNIWICVSCGKTSQRVKLDEDEKEALIEFAKYFRKTVQEKQTARKGINQEKDMKLELAILAGAESKQFLMDFKTQIDRLEALSGKVGGKGKVAASEEEPEEVTDPDDDDDMDMKKAKSKGKVAAPADDDDDEPAADDDEDFGAAPAKTKAKAKAKKLTLDDVNDACRTKAKAIGAEGRATVLGVLKKKFKTDTVTTLKPEQYEAVIAAVNAIDED